MKKMIICIICVFGIAYAEPENSTDATIKQESSPSNNVVQNTDPINTDSQNTASMPYDDFTAMMQNANASLNSAMAFAKMGDY
ncbi:hypothetical protein B9T66_08710, partial [Helicobacter sp. TUL]